MPCQIKSRRPKAASVGHAADQRRRALLGAGGMGKSRASMPFSSASCWLTPSALELVVRMAAHLLAQSLDDVTGDTGDLGRLEAPGPVDLDRELGDHPAGAAREHEDPIAEAHRLPHVVGDEDDGDARVGPYPLELVVEEVARAGVEGTERPV